MRDPRQAVELDVVLVGVTQQLFFDPLAQGSGLVKVFGKPGHSPAGQFKQLGHVAAALLIFWAGGGLVSATVDFIEPMVQGLDKLSLRLGFCSRSSWR